MDAFDAFLHHLPAMTEGKVTSFHMLETEVSGFAYRCMPLLQSSGLPTDHKACSEAIRSGDFMLNEFVDRFGPRLAHLNGVLQVLSQLSSTHDAANTHNIP